jgi:ribosome biogenesis GTPase
LHSRHHQEPELSPIDLDAYEDEYEPEDDRGRRRDERISTEAAARIAATEDIGTVLSTHRGEAEVLHDDVRQPAAYAGSMRGERVAVGDRVRLRLPENATDVARILDVLDRRTHLSRADEDGEAGRVMAANVDRAVLVVSADALRAGRRLLERVLVAASIGHLPVSVVVNKADLVEATELDRSLAAIAEEAQVLATSATEGTGLDAVRQLFSDGWSVMVGHSGVGKSTLFNALVPEVERRVGEVGRHGGRHTTVRAAAYRVGDGWLVDTPGIRSFGITGVDADELHNHWPGLQALGCESPDCTHTGEEGCRAEELVRASRLERYHGVHAALVESSGR